MHNGCIDLSRFMLGFNKMKHMPLLSIATGNILHYCFAALLSFSVTWCCNGTHLKCNDVEPGKAYLSCPNSNRQCDRRGGNRICQREY